MIITRNHLAIALLVWFTSSAFAQENNRTKDTINTEVVNVVKPYTPTISDAFKVKEIPSLDDEVTETRKEVKYNIFSIPVASTFTPAKATAAAVDKAEPVKLYDNYASFGVGSYTSFLGEVYLNHAINSTESVGGYVSHHSSQGGIDGVLLNDDFSDTRFNANYSRKSSDFSWNVDAGARHQIFNWYGLPESLDEDSTPDIDPQHTYFTFDFGGEIKFDDRIINDGRMRFRRFADDFDSGENRFTFSTNVDIPLNDGDLNTTFKFDYLGGAFEQSYFGTDKIEYGNFQIGVIPSYQIIEDDLTVNLGVSAYYMKDNEASKNKFYIFPKVTASYRLVDEILTSYGGIEGDLIQNSYYDFATKNPFVSPTLFIMPTDQQYNAYVGLKGKLSNNMSYNIRGNYIAENNKALFKNNTQRNYSPENGYNQGNSFGVVYDDVNTFSLFGEINVDVNRNFNLGIKAEYFTYTTEDQEKVWNLPDFEASLFMDFQIDKHWFAGANLFYVGERFDQGSLEGALDPEADLTFTMALESYFDANVHLGYRINDQWSVYAKANNIANQDYKRWMNFQVQGLQFLAGTTYKFDF